MSRLQFYFGVVSITLLGKIADKVLDWVFKPIVGRNIEHVLEKQDGHTWLERALKSMRGALDMVPDAFWWGAITILLLWGLAEAIAWRRRYDNSPGGTPPNVVSNEAALAPVELMIHHGRRNALRRSVVKSGQLKVTTAQESPFIFKVTQEPRLIVRAEVVNSAAKPVPNVIPRVASIKRLQNGEWLDILDGHRPQLGWVGAYPIRFSPRTLTQNTPEGFGMLEYYGGSKELRFYNYERFSFNEALQTGQYQVTIEIYNEEKGRLMSFVLSLDRDHENDILYFDIDEDEA